MFKQIMKTASACILSAGIGFGVGAAPATATLTDALTQYDQTTIEQDLASVDLSVYAKDGNGRHRLIDEAGFMEYAYSSDASVAEDYFGIYFYVYNPTGREVSSRTGANVVNMAVAYDTEGEPTEYANCAITILDYTDDYLIYKFKLTNSAGAYDRAKVYAAAHDGVRRYDIAGIQLWFSGDANATDSNSANEEKGRTYRCTGYSKGCGADKDADSTLQIAEEKLDTISLDVEHTFWRTMSSSLGSGHQNQLDTVYFTVPDQYFEEYGKLQRIMAEWYEFKLKPALITSEDSFYNGIGNYIGKQLPWISEWFQSYGVGREGYFDESILWSFGSYVSSKMDGFVWNATYDPEDPVDTPMEALYLIFNTNGVDIDSYDPYADIQSQGGIMRNAIENYIYSYDRSFENGTVNVKEKGVSADLFERDIDGSRKVNNTSGIVQSGFDGISRYDFDIDADIQEMVSWDDTDPSWWDNVKDFGLWNTLFGKIPDETGREFAPIYFPKESDFAGTPENISDNLMCQVADVEKIRAAYNEAKSQEKTLVFFRFAVTDYRSESAQLREWEKRSVLGNDSIKSSTNNAYIAQQTIFLNFDIIQLTFNDGGNLTVIPVVADPIDIINPYTPPVISGNFDWALVAILAGVALVSLVGIGLGAAKEK